MPRSAKDLLENIDRHFRFESWKALVAWNWKALNGPNGSFLWFFSFCYGISKICQGTSSMRFSNSWNANPKARRRSTSEIIDFRPVSCDARLKPHKTQKYHIALCLTPFYADFYYECGRYQPILTTKKFKKIQKIKNKNTPMLSSAKLLSAKLPHAASVIFSSGALQEKERRVNILYWIDGQVYLSTHIYSKSSALNVTITVCTFSLLVCLFPSLPSANCVV